MGEQIVKKKLINKGWQFITQNFHSRNGEIDLIFLDGVILCFIEVKTRTNQNSGHPEEAITAAKLANIRKTAQYFLLKNPQYQDHQLRIDVAAIENQSLHYYKNVY